jgi:hypothetical protein
MKAIITKLESGHLIEITNGDKTTTHAVGKFYAVITCLKQYFSDAKITVKKKQKPKKACNGKTKIK